MLRIVLGYKTPSLTEDPVVLYCGCDGDKAEAAVQRAGDLRVEMASAPMLVRRRGYTAPSVPAETKKKVKTL